MRSITYNYKGIFLGHHKISVSIKYLSYTAYDCWGHYQERKTFKKKHTFKKGLLRVLDASKVNKIMNRMKRSY